MNTMTRYDPIKRLEAANSALQAALAAHELHNTADTLTEEEMASGDVERAKEELLDAILYGA